MSLGVDEVSRGEISPKKAANFGQILRGNKSMSIPKHSINHRCNLSSDSS